MQISCPYCSASLRLGDPQPGRFRPKCKQCGRAFLIQISQDDPPRVRIGPLEQANAGGVGSKTKTPSETPKPKAAAKPSGASKPTGASKTRNASKPRAASTTRAAVEKTIEQTVDQTAAPRSVPRHAVPRHAESKDDTLLPAPSRLGGYRIVRMLGRGAMGAVYQAKQISLDRDVALKTIRGRLADNPASLARFTREAYAAAQLSHHNVVQIYDFGEDAGQHYFSMEWIRGGSLGDLVREKGALDPKLAATYILQAARGLQFAHRSGMVHRDVKPANLLLSDDGVVKVADLGLIKVPDQIDSESASESLADVGLQSGTQVTMQGTAVGTPAYMAPEQSADASTVDHRADIYSLGCSLFYLLAGRSPYDGSVVSEVMEQHAHAPLPNLAEINPRVPAPLCQIVSRAMAKRPSDRYGSLAEMIDDLQSWLGVESMTGFSPTSDQADDWESLAAAYCQTQSLKRLSDPLVIGLAAAAILVTVLTPLVAVRGILFGPFLFVVACLVAIVLRSVSGHSAIADHARRWIGTLSWIELAAGSLALVLVPLILLVSGLWIGALLGGIFGAVAGGVYHVAVTAASDKAGQQPLADARRFVRDLRIGGADENGLRDFLARYAGKRWQTIYEALFGYDALVATRQRLAFDSSFSGPTAGHTVRDRLCGLLKRKAEANRQAIDRAKLAELERNSLVSQGLSVSEAREQSWQMAAAIMESAQLTAGQPANDERVIAEAKRKRIKAMLADARSGRYKRPRDRFAAVKFALSGFSRLLAGCLLLAAFAFAAQSTGLFNEELVDRVRSGQLDLQSLPSDATTDALGESTSLWSLGIAGFLLCLSAFVSGWRMTPFALVATLMILFGANLGVPAIGPADPWMVAAAAGLVIYLPGILFGETEG